MEFKRLQSITDAFDCFTTIEDSDMPDYYKAFVPHKCKCGSDIIMTRTDSEYGGYTQVQCCNPFCWVKNAHRFSYFASSLGFKGLGPKSSMTLFSVFKDNPNALSFFNVFRFSDEDVSNALGPAYGAKFAELRKYLQETPLQFKDIFCAMGIPEVGQNSNLFSIVKSPGILISAAQKKELDRLLGIVSINSPRARFFIGKVGLIDLLEFMNILKPNIVSTPSKEVYVAITGNVTCNGTDFRRDQFIKYCEQICDDDGQPYYKLVETKAASKLEYVISDYPSESSKYELGKKLGILISSTDFYNLLKEGVKKSDG